MKVERIDIFIGNRPECEMQLPFSDMFEPLNYTISAEDISADDAQWQHIRTLKPDVPRDEDAMDMSLENNGRDIQILSNILDRHVALQLTIKGKEMVRMYYPDNDPMAIIPYLL